MQCEQVFIYQLPGTCAIQKKETCSLSESWLLWEISKGSDSRVFKKVTETERYRATEAERYRDRELKRLRKTRKWKTCKLRDTTERLTSEEAEIGRQRHMGREKKVEDTDRHTHKRTGTHRVTQTGAEIHRGQGLPRK